MVFLRNENFVRSGFGKVGNLTVQQQREDVFSILLSQA